jgi:hypothetical protein
MEAICSSETSVETQRAKRRHIPEDVTACRFRLNLFLPPWRWRRYVPPKRRFWSKGSCHEMQEFKKFLNNTTAAHISTNPSVMAVKAELSRSCSVDVLIRSKHSSAPIAKREWSVVIRRINTSFPSLVTAHYHTTSSHLNLSCGSTLMQTPLKSISASLNVVT